MVKINTTNQRNEIKHIPIMPVSNEEQGPTTKTLPLLEFKTPFD